MIRLLLLAVLLVAAACSSADGSGHEEVRDPDPDVTRSTEATAGAAPARVRLTQVGEAEQPTAMAWCEGRAEPLVAEKEGRVRALGGGDAVVDLTDDISTGGEQGLLGLACRGDRLYVSYTNRAGDSRVEEVGPDGAVRRILAVDQPASNHNGGGIAFGPDGRLWLGLGDGGGANDTYDNAQDADDVLGSMLRIDVDAARPEPEIVAKGLRNPWRWSFDRQTDDLWIGDVGQGEVEEIDRLPAGFDGANLGWPAFEGTRRNRTDVRPPAGAVMPVFEYGHDEGQSVVGGYVYRGTAVPGLAGRYLFADTYAARLRALDPDTLAVQDLGAVPGGFVSSFAEDPDGELYVLSLAGGIHRLDAA